jgi:hypothetical protein
MRISSLLAKSLVRNIWAGLEHVSAQSKRKLAKTCQKVRALQEE